MKYHENEKCPGQVRSMEKPEKMVYYLKCPRCCYEVEFFYDDEIRKCPECGLDVNRDASKLENLGCVEWCKAAEKCIGSDLYKKLIKIKGGGKND